MPNNNNQRVYNMLDAELCMFTSNLCNVLTRDLSDLAVFGLTAAKIASLKALGDAFELFPADGSLVGEVMITTENKNAIREQVLAEIRNMVLRVEAKWGADNARCRTLNISSPSQLSDDSLLASAKWVHTKMTEFLPELADYGLSKEVLDAFADLNEKFELAKNAQAEANSMRILKAEERVNKGNELYELVSNYCGFGKKLYEKTSPAKYNDYIIYSPSAGGLKPPTGLKYLIEHNTAVWDAVENATSYEMQYSPDEAKWSEAYSGADTTVHYIPPQGGTAFFRCRARNANGYGDFSEVVKVEIPMPS